MLESMGISVLANYGNLRVNTDNIMAMDFEFETIYDPKFVIDVDAITDAIDDLTNGDGGNENNSGTEDTVQLSFNLPDDPQITYNDSTGAITLTDENGNEQTIELPKDENGNTEFPVTIVDGGGDTYIVTKDDNGSVSVTKNNPPTINENGGQNNNNIIDTVRAKEKVKELIPILQERIRNNLSSESEQFLQYAYNDVEQLTVIASFNPTVSGGGRYVNGQLFVGTLGFIDGSTDEDIIVTVFHEYLHYISHKYSIFEYRMENEKRGIIYSEIDVCFEKKQETEEEFLQRMCESFIYSNLPRTSYYPGYYYELTEEQRKEVLEYIKLHKQVPDTNRCFKFQYKPSNYFKDELNAHTLTLSVNEKLFQMSQQKQTIYRSEIDLYNELYEKALKFESINNYNSMGYENNK
jgi:hypothetical protein